MSAWPSARRIRRASTLYAITNNKNYHTGFAMGMLLVKAIMSGVRLTWNAPINGKMTVEEAAAFDFKRDAAL